MTNKKNIKWECTLKHKHNYMCKQDPVAYRKFYELDNPVPPQPSDHFRDDPNKADSKPVEPTEKCEEPWCCHHPKCLLAKCRSLPQSWEEDFREYAIRGMFGDKIDGDSIKSFIRTLLANQKKALIEKVEKKRVKAGGWGWTEEDALERNQLLNDIIAELKGEK